MKSTLITLLSCVRACPAAGDLEIFLNDDFVFTMQYYTDNVPGQEPGVGLDITLPPELQSTFDGWPRLPRTTGLLDRPSGPFGTRKLAFLRDNVDVEISSRSAISWEWFDLLDGLDVLDPFLLGETVGPGSFDVQNGYDVKIYIPDSDFCYSLWSSPGVLVWFVGVAVEIDAQTHYGWVLLTDDYPSDIGIQPIAWAYETEPDVPAVTVDPFAPACSADTNVDGNVTPADFNGWILAFNAQSRACDQNADGFCTSADFNAWILNYNAGC